MAEVTARIKKQYQEFNNKKWPNYHGRTCNVLVENVEVKKKLGQSNQHSTTYRQITCSDLFNIKGCDNKHVKKVLVEGYGGIGKTTLCTSLCIDWANGSLLQQFSLVLFLPLCNNQVISADSLSKLLKLLFPVEQERKTIRRILREEEDKVLIIADGWNQVHKGDHQDQSFLHQLLSGQLLPQVSVLVTSRPSASTSLHNLQCIDQVVEIHGFNKYSIRQYISCVLATEKAHQLLNQLQHNQAAEALCSVPLNCAILSHLWHSFGTEIVPATMTELYTAFISNVIIRKVRKSHPDYNNVHLCFTALPDDLQEYFWRWCEFAFQTVEKKQTIFSQHNVTCYFPECSDDIRSCFSLLQPVEVPFEALKGASLQFLHPIILEYLAILHLTRQDMGTQLEICKSNTELNWKFYFGLLRQSQNEEANLLIEILSQIISHKLVMCHCAYEAGCDVVNSIMADRICGQFSFSGINPHTAYDFSAVVHVLAHTHRSSDIQISFNNCSLTDTQVTQLTAKLGSKLQRHKVTKLDLHGNQLTHNGIFKILQRVIPTYHLTHLVLSHNSVEVDGLQTLEVAICENMLVNIQKLILQNCLTCDPDVNGALLTTFLDSVLTSCQKLCCLDLSENNLGVPGAQALCQTMLSQPNLSLYLNNTSLGDEGLRALAQGNWSLEQLGLQENCIHAIGISSLVESISSGRCTVGSLYLDDNPLGLEGSRAMGKILCGGNSIELSVVSLSRCNLTNAIDAHNKIRDISRELFEACQNHTIKELYVNENDFAGESIDILAGFLYLCPKIQYIHSSHCDIASAEVKRLVRKLPSLQLGWSELRFWQLEYNMIDDSAVQYFAILIRKMNTCLDNNLITNKMAKENWKKKWLTVLCYSDHLVKHITYEPRMWEYMHAVRDLQEQSDIPYFQENSHVQLKHSYVKPDHPKQTPSQMTKDFEDVNPKLRRKSDRDSYQKQSLTTQESTNSHLNRIQPSGTKSAVTQQNPLDRVVSDYHIADIAQDLKDWEEIAPWICLSESEQKEIKEDYQGRYNLQKRQALHTWRKNCGDKATYRALLDVFQTQGLTGLAELVKEKASTKNQTPISSVVMDTVYRYLLDCYCDLPYPPMQQLSSPELHCQHQIEYVDLTFREVPITNLSKDLSTDRLVELSTVLSSHSEGLVVLFEGVGGSGKTAFSWHICRKWAKKELLQQFHLLIHVQVRNPQIQSAKCLADIIPHPEKKVRAEVATAICDQKGKGVCILLDGLDEASSPLLDTLFSMITDRQRALIPQISFIVTTRPNMHITSKLQPVLKVKIMLEGFSSEKLHEFFKNVLGEQSPHYNSLVEKFKANPQLEWVCAHPINAVITAFLVHVYEGDLPVTQTGLYRALVIHFINRHIQSSSTEEPQMIDNFEFLPSNVKPSFKMLCKWAYRASLSKKRLFTAKELGVANVDFDNALGLLQIQPKITMYGTERYYSFTHLSIQEFIAAVHISLKPNEHHVKSVQQLLEADPLNHALPFYAGLTGLSNSRVRKLLSKVLKHPLQEQYTLAAIRNNPTESNDPRRKTLALFNCLYECQNKSLLECQEFQLPHFDIFDKARRGEIKQHSVSFLGLGLTPSDCIAIGYFMRMNTLLSKDKTIIMFQMGICSDIGLASFMKELRKGVDMKTPTQLMMRLVYSSLGTNSQLALRDLLRGQSNIVSLQLSYCSSVSNTSIALKSIVEGLAANSSCEIIELPYMGIRSVHVHYLILLLMYSSLNSFGISNADLGKAMNLFSGALRYTSLRRLSLQKCGIDDAGLFLLGVAIRDNRCITGLDIPGNETITSDGVINFLWLFVVSQSALRFVIMDDHVVHDLSGMPDYKDLLHRIRCQVISFDDIFNWARAKKPFVVSHDDDLIARTDVV